MWYVASTISILLISCLLVGVHMFHHSFYVAFNFTLTICIILFTSLSMYHLTYVTFKIYHLFSFHFLIFKHVLPFLWHNILEQREIPVQFCPFLICISFYHDNVYTSWTSPLMIMWPAPSIIVIAIVSVWVNVDTWFTYNHVCCDFQLGFTFYHWSCCKGLLYYHTYGDIDFSFPPVIFCSHCVFCLSGRRYGGNPGVAWFLLQWEQEWFPVGLSEERKEYLRLES